MSARQTNQDFVNNLIACTSLKRVELSSISPVDQLTAFLAKRESKFGSSCSCFEYYDSDDQGPLDSDSHFPSIMAYGDMITSLKLNVYGWDRRFAIVVKHVAATRQNLNTLDIDLAYIPGTTEGLDAALMKFFDSEERALKLHRLYLVGYDIGQAVFESIFKNCLNLKTRHIQACNELNNNHLIEWASRGGGGRQLSELNVRYCDNINADGILPVFVNSVDRLRHFSYYDSGRQLNTPEQDERLWNGLFKHCRDLEMVEGCPEAIENFTGCHKTSSDPPTCMH